MIRPPTWNCFYRFDINQPKSTKETNAINIRIIETQNPRAPIGACASAGTGNTPSTPTGSGDIVTEIKNSDSEQVQKRRQRRQDAKARGELIFFA